MESTFSTLLEGLIADFDTGFAKLMEYDHFSSREYFTKDLMEKGATQ